MKNPVGRPRLPDEVKAERERERQRLRYKKNKQEFLNKAQRRSKDGIGWYMAYKRSLKCADCPVTFETYPDLCDFHHIDPSTKSKATIPHMARNGSRTLAMAEIAKCVPLCANCHRIRHAKERLDISQTE